MRGSWARLVGLNLLTHSVPSEIVVPNEREPEVVAGVGAGRTRPVTRGAVALAGSSATVRGAASASLAVGASAGTANVTGLRSETAYDVYLVAQDDTTPTPNVQTSVTKLQFTTRDATAPTFATDYPKSYQGGVAVEVVVKVDEPGRAYFVVVGGVASV